MNEINRLTMGQFSKVLGVVLLCMYVPMYVCSVGDKSDSVLPLPELVTICTFKHLMVMIQICSLTLSYHIFFR